MKIFFITPYFSFGGSEILLRNLCLELNKRGWNIAIYSIEKGDLFKLEPLPFPVYSSPYRTSSFRQILLKICRRLFGVDLEKRHLLRMAKRFGPDLWYINTSVLPDIAELAHENNIPYVVHSHELHSVLAGFQAGTFKSMIDNAKAVIACSSCVKIMLDELAEKQSLLLHSFINAKDVASCEDDRTRIRKELSIPANSFVWAMSGGRSYRKGIDFLPEIVSRMDSANNFFIWIGGESNNALHAWVTESFRKKGIRNVSFIPYKTSDYYHYLNICDGFLLTSREDPFPLVMLEAAALGKPIVGFCSGGIEEFVLEGMGKVVPSFDMDELEMAMSQISGNKIPYDPELLRSRAAEFSIDKAADEWESMIKNVKVK